MPKLLIYTIGHSNHPLDTFVSILKKHSIKTLVDVRSTPYSRYAPQFNYGSLEPQFVKYRIDCHYMGNILGGLPKDPKFIKNDGGVDYDLLAEDDKFLEGIDKLVQLAKRGAVCIMCGEENPARCHRASIIAPLLAARGATVRHIRTSGELDPMQMQIQQDENNNEHGTSEQIDLFNTD